jgi:Flp pilus assembly protein TadB
MFLKVGLRGRIAMSKTPEEKRAMRLRYMIGVLAIVIITLALKGNGWVQFLSIALIFVAVACFGAFLPRWVAKRRRNRNLNR